MFLLLDLFAPQETATRAAKPAAKSSPEATFLSTRASHSLLEAEFLDLCAQKAQRSELQMFCREQGAAERTRATQFNGWLQTWYVVAKPTKKDKDDQKKHKQSNTRIQSASPAEWENICLRELRQRSRQESSELAGCSASAVHVEMKTACTEMTANHDKNEKQMDEWICQWYRDCTERH